MAMAAAQLAKEVALVVVGGVALSLLANTVSPRGLRLDRDYFAGTVPRAAPANTAAPSSSAGATPAITATDAPPAKPTRSAHGIPFVDHAAAAALFHDGRYAAGLLMFVDARDDDHFQAGHIPGAYGFDHYRPEKTISSLLAPAALAEKIVVYCNGGTCEDSDLAAADLVAFGVPAEKLVIYSGGITEWKQRGLPLETGRRGSGQKLKP